MRKLSVSRVFNSNSDKEKQTLFWINGQSIFVVAGKKRHTHKFTSPTGFKEGKVDDFDLAYKTIKGICKDDSLKIGGLFSKNKVTIFIPTDSAPIEKNLVKDLFKKVGFFDVDLLKYETAFRAFLAKQDYENATFVYVGHELAEIGVFGKSSQQSFIIYFSLKEAIEEIIYFFREKHLFELSEDVALNIYQELGQQGDKFSLVIRGRSSRTQELQTNPFSFKDLEPLFSFLQKKIAKEMDSIIQNNLFKQIAPDKWVVLGDDFFKRYLDTFGEKSLKLKSEFDLMQGVKWL
jgi:actin-like ATPase involved in cell morphogenesis